MDREEKLNAVFAQFDRSAKEFCEAGNGALCEITSEYKGEEKPQDLKYRFAKIYFNSFTVKFIYTAHGILNTVNSILECYICFDKQENSPEIPLPLAIDYCDITTASLLCIPFITNELAMIQAFSEIGGVLKEHLPVFADISYDPERKAQITAAFRAELMSLFDIEISTEDNEAFSPFYYSFFTLRFSSDAFINYIKGNNALALKQLKKIKKPTGYEKRFIGILESGNLKEHARISSISENANAYNNSGVPKANLKEFISLFLSWIILTPAASAVYTAFYFLLVFIQSRNSVYIIGPLYNFPYCILFGFVTAISISYFVRFKIYKLIYKKDYEKYCEIDYIQNGGGADKLMKGFTNVLVVIGLVGCVLLAEWNLNFLADGFIDNSKFFSIKGQYYAYNEIEKVYYKPNRVNALNETLEFPSYVLVLQNGREIDLYEHGEIEDYEDELIGHLREKGVKIE